MRSNPVCDIDCTWSERGCLAVNVPFMREFRQAMSRDAFQDALSAEPRAIFMDESIRTVTFKVSSDATPYEAQYYVMTAVQVNGNDAAEVRARAGELREAMREVSRTIFNESGNYWHTTQALKTPEGRVAFVDMAALVGEYCTVRVGIASIDQAREDLIKQGKDASGAKVQARHRAMEASLKQFEDTKRTTLVVTDAVNKIDRRGKRVEDERVMKADLTLFARLRQGRQCAALHRQARLVHTSQASDPLMWTADVAASAFSRALLGQWEFALEIAESPDLLVAHADSPSRGWWTMQANRRDALERRRQETNRQRTTRALSHTVVRQPTRTEGKPVTPQRAAPGDGLDAQVVEARKAFMIVHTAFPTVRPSSSQPPTMGRSLPTAKGRGSDPTL